MINQRLAWVTATLLVLGGELDAQQNGRVVASEYRAAHEAEIVRSFAELLRYPNVASDSVGIHAAANRIAEQLESVGVRSELWKIPGAPPVVYGELMVPGATRTLGIYVHYDGQPVDSSQWRHGPWSPTLYTAAMESGGVVRDLPNDGDFVDPEWRIYARSAGDDKAPITALVTVLRAFSEAGIQPTSNLRFFFEGEEEAGSPKLREYLTAHDETLQDIDVWLFCDGPVYQTRQPLVTFGVRGVTGLEVTLFGATRALHSGHYGNWAPVPGQMLAALLASMKGEDGRVLIEGFYDTVEPLGDQERAALEAVPDIDALLREELGLLQTEGSGQSLAERLMLPSLTIRGLSSGNVGASARNVIPNSATAALGVRLVKGNDPEAMLDLVEAHIRSRGYHIVREDPDLETRLRYPRIAKVTRQGGYPAARTSMSTPVVQDVLAAMRSVAGEDLVVVPALGGSLPLYLFTDVLGKAAMVVPIANHDNNQHAANENLRIANLWYGIDLYGSILTMPSSAGF